MSGYFVGVEVGSEHVAAGLFDERGAMRGRVARPVTPWQPESGRVEQSADRVWEHCGACIGAVLAQAAIAPSAVRGLGFASMGALVALDNDGRPCSMSPPGDEARDIIVELDQRAVAEAEAINATEHEALNYVGGGVTPEHALPRLLWLKRNHPEQYRRAGLFLDLSEYLAYRATAQVVRSREVIGSQWLYQAHEDRWPEELFEAIGLDDLVAVQRLGACIQASGTSVGSLTEAAADALGLAPHTVVTTGMTQAGAGGIGLLGAAPEGKLALVAGLSARHLAISRRPVFAEGATGPVQGGLTPDQWVTQAGQSAFGALLDYVISDSAGYRELLRGCDEKACSARELLQERIAALESREENPTRTLHVLDYHHGARTPRPDPLARGMVSGLTMDQDVDALARRYLATLQALCYGTRYIIEAMRHGGHQLEAIRACGLLADNPLWCRELADATGLPLEVPCQGDPVLMGPALAAATAGGEYEALADAMAAAETEPQVIEPRGARAHFHDAKYQVYCRLYDDQIAYRELMGRV